MKISPAFHTTTLQHSRRHPNTSALMQYFVCVLRVRLVPALRLVSMGFQDLMGAQAGLAKVVNRSYHSANFRDTWEKNQLAHAYDDRITDLLPLSQSSYCCLPRINPRTFKSRYLDLMGLHRWSGKKSHNQIRAATPTWSSVHTFPDYGVLHAKYPRVPIGDMTPKERKKRVRV